MDTTAYLFSIRLQGWMSRHGNYTSDLGEARQFTLGEAITMSKRHKDGRGISLVPVRKEDMDLL